MVVILVGVRLKSVTVYRECEREQTREEVVASVVTACWRSVREEVVASVLLIVVYCVIVIVCSLWTAVVFPTLGFPR